MNHNHILQWNTKSAILMKHTQNSKVRCILFLCKNLFICSETLHLWIKFFSTNHLHFHMHNMLCITLRFGMHKLFLVQESVVHVSLYFFLSCACYIQCLLFTRFVHFKIMSRIVMHWYCA